MAYTNVWSVTRPAGTLRVKQIDDEVRTFRVDMAERLTDLFGVDMSADPLVPTKVGNAITMQESQAGTPIYNAGNSGTALTIDFDNGDQQKITLTGNCTLTLSNVIAGRTYVFYIVQDGTGGRTITFPSSCRASGGSNFGTPTLTTTASRLSIVTLTAYTTSILAGAVIHTGVNVS